MKIGGMLKKFTTRIKNQMEPNRSKSKQFQLSLQFLLLAVVFFITTSESLAQSLTIAEYRARAVWEAVKMDVHIDLTRKAPTYKGTMTLKTEAKGSKGPVLMLNLRKASMLMTSVKVLDMDSKDFDIKTYKNPNKKGEASLFVIDLKPSGQSPTEVKISFEYKFIAEQGQVLQKGHLSYAGWVTGWHPFPIDDVEDLASAKKLSIPGTTNFILPEGWQALSNGKLIYDKNNKQTWEVGPSIARSYIAAPYNVSAVKQGGIDIKMYRLNRGNNDSKEKASQFAKILGVLENAFGDYPYDTFALAEIPDKTTDYFGAASEQGFIVAESKNFEKDDGAALFAHELGHSWWGNLFSCEGKGGSLCSEALAQFGAVLAIEKLYGKEALRDFLDVSVPTYSTYQSARGYFAVLRSNLDTPLSEIDNSSWKVHRLMDSKGMWFWQMLRHEVGDDLLFKILKDLTKQKAGMTLEDVQAFFSKKSGKDLNPFFNQWLKRKGAPIISVSWETPLDKVTNKFFSDKPIENLVVGKPITEFKVTVNLKQEQKELYALKIPIEFQFYYAPSVIREVELNQRDQAFVFKFSSNIKNIIIDPDHTILMWRPEYGPKPTNQ
jgi:hypothetical protein